MAKRKDDTVPASCHRRQPADAVRRMRPIAAGYGLDDDTLATTMGLIPERLLEVTRFVHQRADEGVAGFVRFVADGRAGVWSTNAVLAAARLPAWLEALSS